MTVRKPDDFMPLIVTENGVPCADQADGLRRFKQACVRYTVQLSYPELAHMLAWHHENEKQMAEARCYEIADYHKRRFEELEALRLKVDKP